MADNKVLRIDDDGPVRLLTLNRPEAKNAFNRALYDGVRMALDEAAADDSVTVCVITGAGDIFSAGQDIKALAAMKDNPDEAKGFDPFARALASFDKPLIAAVNGAAVGVGTTLLLHCDLVLVSDAARFKLPFVGLGLVPEAASSVLLPATIGPQDAAYYLLTGDWMDAETAVARGLAWKRYAPERLLEEALGLAGGIAKAPLGSLRNTKQLLQAGRADAIQAALDREISYLGEITRRYLQS
ncbi:MAG TPA: enoyl-CoA hydratase-related protein [Acidimicrobiia bacterium]|nr:enoyl-CoA hydratase-related protein [Acidimicrobiia bacterium]